MSAGNFWSSHFLKNRLNTYKFSQIFSWKLSEFELKILAECRKCVTRGQRYVLEFFLKKHFLIMVCVFLWNFLAWLSRLHSTCPHKNFGEEQLSRKFHFFGSSGYFSSEIKRRVIAKSIKFHSTYQKERFGCYAFEKKWKSFLRESFGKNIFQEICIFFFVFSAKKFLVF